MVDIIANNGIPMSIDGSIIGFLGAEAPPLVETTILETFGSAPLGGTSLSGSSTRLAQNFKMPQALSGNLKTYIYGTISLSPDLDLSISIVGVVGDVSTGDPYPTEILGTSNAVAIDASTANGYMAFDFSGITLQDGSTYAAMLTPSNITSIFGWSWGRSGGISDLYPDGIAKSSANAGSTWNLILSNLKEDYKLKLTHEV